MSMRKVVGLVCIALVCGCADNRSEASQAETVEPGTTQPSTATFVRHDGGSIRTSLGYGIVLNKESNLAREWVVTEDSMMPLRIVSPTGIRTIYDAGGRYASGSYKYAAQLEVEATEPVAAFEVRFVVFDIWGEFVKTLTMTEIEDIPAGTVKPYAPRWNLYSENEASEYYASIAYIARVRTALGRVVEANYRPIVEEARRFSDQFTPEQLDPRRTPPADTAGGRVAGN